MKKIIFTMLFLGITMTMSAQVFSIAKQRGGKGFAKMERVSVYSNIFVDRHGIYYLRANSISENNTIYVIDLGNENEVKTNLGILSFFADHKNDSMGKEFRFVADSVINIKDIDIKGKELANEIKRLTK